ncbi:hypothetical protein SEA_KOZIE_7 [Microbacterium phage Kozie]|uniref:Uncharacterized protein n=1 Tax=Microbacterium phage Kozie TaxID=2885981 RepID=A0AAE9C2S0_9CAUD|nr:hypothetical protein QC998_gp07 [Microbacterium phage Kozie]UDL16203.1 hypothetical protein SEA_KOZIE_7 [Microbacterium phage Kozie]
MTAFTDYLAADVSPAAYSWCECGKSWRGPRSHASAHAHGASAGHVTHLWTPDEGACADLLTSPLLGTLSCDAPAGHDGDHYKAPTAARGAHRWPNRGVDNSVESGDNS